MRQGWPAVWSYMASATTPRAVQHTVRTQLVRTSIGGPTTYTVRWEQPGGIRDHAENILPAASVFRKMTRH